MAAARACREAGFRTYRHATDGREQVVDRFELVRRMHSDCAQIWRGAGDGGWAIDFHTKLDMADAINLAVLLEPDFPGFTEIYRVLPPDGAECWMPTR